MLYYLRVKDRNNGVSDLDNPHICIGRKDLGDLSNCDKQEITARIKKYYPKIMSVASVHINFVLNMKIGDIVIFDDGNKEFHIGEITSDYYYKTADENVQDADYVHNRNVKWLLHYSRDILSKEINKWFGNNQGRGLHCIQSDELEPLFSKYIDGSYFNSNPCFNNLKSYTDELDSNKHNASYELVQAILEEYKNQKNIQIDSKDIRLLYTSTVLKYKKETRERYIKDSNLSDESKDRLLNLLINIEDKTENNHYDSDKVGMFGTGKGELNITKENAAHLFNLLIKIFDTQDETECLKVVKSELKEKIDGVEDATVSQILHCIKPKVFPVFNGGTPKEFFKELGLDIKPGIINYWKNVVKLKSFRDYFFNFKNYRLIDLEAQKFNKEKTMIEPTVSYSKEFNKLKFYSNVGNVIFYGVPGCGKSYEIDEMLKNEKNVSRVLFYPDYSYSDFIGQLLPTVDKDGEKESVTYKFTPGPFIEILEKAIANENEKFYLIIEEINRGNAPAIFGDMFQLLDRNKDCESVYPIDNKQVKDYWKEQSLNSETKEKYKMILSKLKNEKLYIPKNLIIFATMNTCDQNVFTLDTAFKRRWVMHRVYNDLNSTDKILKMEIKSAKMDPSCTWGRFAKVINDEIINDEDSLNSEDKQLGAHFVKEFELEDTDCNIFAEKVLMYLWEDVVKFNPHKLFVERIENFNVNSLENLLNAYKIYGMKVFQQSIYDKLG